LSSNGSSSVSEDDVDRYVVAIGNVKVEGWRRRENGGRSSVWMLERDERKENELVL